MDLKQIKFRNAIIKDLKSIMRIEHSSFSHKVVEKEEVYIERIKTFPDGFLVMEYKSDVIGYICSEIREYREDITKRNFILGHSIKQIHNPNGNEAYISSMGLLHEFRGMGLGNLIFEKFTDYLTSKFDYVRSIVLIVSENWTRARKIYLSHGYKEVLLIKDFFQDDPHHKDNGIVMRKTLRHGQRTTP